MQAVSAIVVIAAGLWLVGVALLMAVRPRVCLHLLQKMSRNLEASNRRVHFVEQGLRALAGIALIVRAPASKLPQAFEVAGWLLLASAVLIMIAPIRWHGAYGSWWAKRISPLLTRALSPVPAVLGTGIIYAAI